MGVFRPPDSCDVSAARLWLVVAMVALAVAGLALLAQAALLWRHETRLGVAWWGRLPLALPMLWAGVCGVAAVWAFISYRAERDLPTCPPGRTCIINLGACLPVPVLGAAQYILLVAAVMLILGWLALACLARGRELART